MQNRNTTGQILALLGPPSFPTILCLFSHLAQLKEEHTNGISWLSESILNHPGFGWFTNDFEQACLSRTIQFLQLVLECKSAKVFLNVFENQELIKYIKPHLDPSLASYYLFQLSSFSTNSKTYLTAATLATDLIQDWDCYFEFNRESVNNNLLEQIQNADISENSKVSRTKFTNRIMSTNARSRTPSRHYQNLVPHIIDWRPENTEEKEEVPENKLQPLHELVPATIAEAELKTEPPFEPIPELCAPERNEASSLSSLTPSSVERSFYSPIFKSPESASKAMPFEDIFISCKRRKF